jgi:phytoene dehydrogenase-like protein
MEKSIIIIGAGLTGLAAGCYGRMNGYKTSIFEMHDKAGGVCTGWRRKGYTIDGAMNWLVGTKPGNSLYKFWEELGAASKWQVFNHDQYLRIEDNSGKTYTVYCDIDRFEQYMLELAPEDKDTIKEFSNALRSCSRLDMPVEKPSELYNFIDMIKMVKMLPLLLFMRKWSKVSVGDFSSRFNNPYLRGVFAQSFGGDMSFFPMFGMLMMLGWQHQKAAGYVIGGALALVDSIERRYKGLGGEIHFSSKVNKILVENDKAIGIKLADGTEHRADYVISAADGRTTIFDMLGGKYIDAKIKGYYDDPQLFPPLIYVALGVNRRFDDIPPSVAGMNFPLDTPVTIAGKERRDLGVLIYNFDPTLAPEGKTVVKVQFDTDYDYWEMLYREPERYKAEKEQIADLVVSLLDKRFPGLASLVEMRDVATPITWVRYTGNWRGSYEGWLFKKGTFSTTMKKTLPGLGNFYMAGQWVNPGGGMPTAAMSGKYTIQFICKKDKKKFVTTKP